MFKCPHCGVEFSTDALFCPNCHAPLTSNTLNGPDTKTVTVSDDVKIEVNALTNAILNRDGLTLFVGNQVINRPIQTRAYIGRDSGLDLDPDTTTIYVNLSQFGGQLFGVSRLHARLDVNENRQYFIMDLSSTNGTKQNNRALKSFQSYPINNGDIIALGKFMIETRLTSTDDS
jgi:pSer/pThr/pTyr-binding forkhead associated (FHA) protein